MRSVTCCQPAEVSAKYEPKGGCTRTRIGAYSRETIQGRSTGLPGTLYL